MPAFGIHHSRAVGTSTPRPIAAAATATTKRHPKPGVTLPPVAAVTTCTTATPAGTVVATGRNSNTSGLAMVAGRHVRPALARVLGMLVLHTCMCTLGGQMAGSAALTAIEEALPRAVQGHEDEDAGRQAEMAVSWGLFNQQRKESGELESASGPGSSRSFTHVTRDYLQDVIERYSVRSIVDVACGDWNWMRQIDLAALGVESYVGYWTIALDMRDACPLSLCLPLLHAVF